MLELAPQQIAADGNRVAAMVMDRSNGKAASLPCDARQCVTHASPPGRWILRHEAARFLGSPCLAALSPRGAGSPARRWRWTTSTCGATGNQLTVSGRVLVTAEDGGLLLLGRRRPALVGAARGAGGRAEGRHGLCAARPASPWPKALLKELPGRL